MNNRISNTTGYVICTEGIRKQIRIYFNYVFQRNAVVMENIDTPAGSIRRRNKHKLALCTASNNEYFVSDLLGARKLAVLMTMIDDDDDYLLECSFLCQNTADSITAACYASLG